MSERVVAADVAALELTEQIPAGVEIVDGAPVAAYRDLIGVGDATIGLWEMTTGTARDVESDEVFVVLSGSGRVRFADGETIELRPGVTVRLREGEQTEWTIADTVRKLYIAG